jgi:hypothetical protein
MKPSRLVRQSIWTTPSLNRTVAWKRKDLRERREAWRQQIVAMGESIESFSQYWGDEPEEQDHE